MLIGVIIQAYKVFTTRNSRGYWALVIQSEGETRHDIYSEDSVDNFVGSMVEIEWRLRLPVKAQDRWKFKFIDSIKKKYPAY